MIGDIEKAFLNIEVCHTDRDCLRFLWFKDCKKELFDIAVYRINRVVFGVNSSPFLLNAVLRHHVETYNEVDLLCENGVEMQPGKGDERQKEDGKEEIESAETYMRPSQIAAQNLHAKTRLMLDDP